MSESVPSFDGSISELVPPDAPPIVGAIDPAMPPAAMPPAAPPMGTSPPAAESPANLPTLPPGTPVTPETEALLEILRRGLAANADPAARAMAHEVSGRVLYKLAPAVVPAPGPLPALAPGPVGASPLAAIVGSLRTLPPDQLLSLALQRLRAALPAGATVAEPKGIQFSLVPVTAAGGPR